MSNSSTKMDVDNPFTLKRSSSAPMINDLSSAMTTSTSTVTTSRESTSFNFFTNAQTRTRRYSASFSPHHTPGGLSPRLTHRVNQLRQEECIDAAGREVAHEREMHSAMVMSQSWEDLRLVGDTPSKDVKSESSDSNGGSGNNKTRICDPLQLSLPLCPSPVCSSPSPTRMLQIRQNFSPSTWKTNLSPSPTRKSFTTRRSSSPIAIRPSTLGPVKRKFEMDDNEPPAKRSGGLLLAQSRLDITESPVTGSLSSVGTPESLSSADSPGGFIDTPNNNTLIDHPMQDLAKSDANPT